MGRKGNKINACRALWGNLKGRNHLEHPLVKERISLQWIL